MYSYPNGDRRSFKANLRPIADVAPPHLRRFTTDLRPECNIYRRYSTVGSAPIGGESAVTFALNRPRFGPGRMSSGHKKMRTAHDWCRRLALIHQPVRFTRSSQKNPHFALPRSNVLQKLFKLLMHKFIESLNLDIFLQNIPA